MKTTFAALYERGPNWIEGRPLADQPLSAHLDHLLALHKDGRLTMGGPYGDETGGLVILTVDDMATAERLIADDPAIIAGTLKASVKVWNRIV